MMFIVQRNDDALGRCRFRLALLAFAWLNVALGLIGAVVPAMPATIFLLIALWAFSKSSRRFHRWLYDHPRWGRGLRAWHEHRAIPPRAKALALATMATSLTVTALWLSEGWMLPALLAALMVPLAAFILTRPGGPHEPDPTPG